MATDLTFQQLSDQLPANSIVVSDGSTPLTAGVYMNPSNITGDSITALSDSGVIETLIKTLNAGRVAQEAMNESAGVGESLNAFNTPASSAPIDNGDGTLTFETTRSLTVENTTNLDNVSGPQV